MQDAKWIDLDVRRPGTRRILEALRQIEEEAPGLIDEAALAATELAKGRGTADMRRSEGDPCRF
jgi:hypothetical protein